VGDCAKATSYEQVDANGRHDEVHARLPH
jgi:hypothetical protein